MNWPMGVQAPLGHTICGKGIWHPVRLVLD